MSSETTVMVWERLKDGDSRVSHWKDEPTYLKFIEQLDPACQPEFAVSIKPGQVGDSRGVGQTILVGDESHADYDASRD